MGVIGGNKEGVMKVGVIGAQSWITVKFVRKFVVE